MPLDCNELDMLLRKSADTSFVASSYTPIHLRAISQVLLNLLDFQTAMSLLLGRDQTELTKETAIDSLKS